MLTVGHEGELLHGAGHRDVQQACTAGRAVEDLMGVDDDDAVELEPLDRFGREQWHVVVTERVDVVDGVQTDRRQRSPDLVVASRWGNDTGQLVSVFDLDHGCGHCSVQIARLDVASTPVWGSRRFATLRIGSGTR